MANDPHVPGLNEVIQQILDKMVLDKTMKALGEVEPLPEDTCVALKKVAYWEDVPESERICMKRRDDKIHQKHYMSGCMCDNSAAHHTFVMGSRPKKKIRCMSDM